MTDELFAVQVKAPDLPVAGEHPVVFHGVNKSGSLSMSKVIRGAYYADGRANRFFSPYHGLPKDFEHFVGILQQSSGHAFYVAHNLYGLDLPRDAVLVTQFRHPLARTLSVRGWYERNHVNRHGSLDGMPDLETWVRSLKGRTNTQMAQLAIGFPPGWEPRRVRSKLAELNPRQVYELAVEQLERDVAWYGIAERFEESIFALAHVCGLPAVPAWTKDTRNQWRQSIAETDPSIIELIVETMAWEIRFYEYALARFDERVGRMAFGASLETYRERCAGEYGEPLPARFSPEALSPPPLSPPARLSLRTRLYRRGVRRPFRGRRA
ncbi:MAG: hypothetical protein MSC31_03395 [Solirubrobacteraceae bacterium MAG38_C4-C5]|nr:hypothetical protein [Candidatus Siliceabacter maunaloa]